MSFIMKTPIGMTPDEAQRWDNCLETLGETNDMLEANESDDGDRETVLWMDVWKDRHLEALDRALALFTTVMDRTRSN